MIKKYSIESCICLCGVMAGYNHADDCPYPMFFSDEKNFIKWNKAREIKKLELNKKIKLKCSAPHAGDSNCPDCP